MNHEDMPLEGSTWQSRFWGFLLLLLFFHKFKTLNFPGTQLLGRLREFHNVFCWALSQELFTGLETLSLTVLPVSGQVRPVCQSTLVTSRLTRAVSLSEALLALSAHTSPGNIPKGQIQIPAGLRWGLRYEFLTSPGEAAASPSAVTAEQRRAQNTCYYELRFLYPSFIW